MKGISHITLIVKDLELASKFFGSIFNAKEIYSSGDNTFSLAKEKFFDIGGQWIVIMEGKSLLERTYNHIAFKIDEGEFEDYESKVLELGLDIKQPRARVKGEGRSLYFYDYDNHLFELHTGTLADRLERYAK